MELIKRDLFILFCMAFSGCLVGVVYFGKSEDYRSFFNVQNRRTDNNELYVVYNEETLRDIAFNISKMLYKPTHQREECIRRFPGVIIVGVAKSGTRELSDFMNLHPNIVVKTGSYKIPNPLFTHLEERRIIDQMPCTFVDQIGSVKSDNMFEEARKAKQIHTLSPNTRIMAIVREPVSRVISQVTFRRWKLDNEAKNQSIYHSLLDGTRTVNENCSLIKASKYYLSLQKYLEYFPMDRIHIVESTEFDEHPSTVLNRVTHFLGLKPFDFSQHIVKNERTGFHCLKRPDNQSMACYMSNRGRNNSESSLFYKETDVESKNKILRDYFRPWNEKLFELIGKRFDHWQV